MMWYFVVNILSTINITSAAKHMYDQHNLTKDIKNGVSGTVDYQFNDGFCSSNGTSAYCKGLEYIPKLPNSTKFLFLSDNNLSFINSTTFQNISYLKLEVLSLNHNKVSEIATDAFECFRFLQVLHFQDEPFLEGAEITKAISVLNESKLYEINFSHTRLQYVDFKIFSGWKNISYITLSDNKLETWELAALKHLKVLNVAQNLVFFLPNFCANNLKKSYLPKLTTLDLSFNDLGRLEEETFKCLPELNSLNLSGNPLKFIKNNFISSLQVLHFLDVSRITSRLAFVYMYTFNSSSLKRLMLERFVPLNVLISNLGLSVRIYCPHLTHLSLSHTVLPNNETEIDILLSNITQIQSIDLSFTGLTFLPKVIFSQMTSLKVLHFEGNKIRSWIGPEIFESSKLFYLSMRRNQISVLNSTSFPSSLLKYLNKKSLDLSENPHMCTCQTLQSITWLRIHAFLLAKYPEDYECFSPPETSGTRLTDYNPSEESCAEKNIPLLVSIPVSIIAVTTMSVILLIYKCRWRLRYGLYLFNNRNTIYEKFEGSDGLKFAGFVIYSDVDGDWVHNELIQKLEVKEGFRLCIRLRDFDVGKVHVDNIVDNMWLSEKIILILSNNFAKDEWCHFQLQLAETRLLKQNKNMLVIFILDEISSDCMRTSLFKLVTEKQFILWSNDETGNELFWKKAVSQMKKSTSLNYGTI